MSENATDEFIPEHALRPVATGTYKNHPDKHVFLAEFAEMTEDDISRSSPTWKPSQPSTVADTARRGRPHDKLERQRPLFFEKGLPRY
ncbi:hypothetical protein VTH06DRAFT_1003 [Thermothelomyces fergusii]